MKHNDGKIAFIGFGEAGQAFASGFADMSAPPTMCAYDVKTEGPDAGSMKTTYTKHGIDDAKSCANACRNAQAIFSMVTAEQAEVAAGSAANTALYNTFYFDCNSCAPETKRRSAGLINAAGGRYVDVAIMTPVHPARQKSPCLLSGLHAEAAKEVMNSLGMNVSVVGLEIGAASARKMIRSVMIKGLEALTLECFLAARKYGIENDILASLDQSYPCFDWPKRAPYMIERAITHGTRRAAEMREVQKTLLDLGIEPRMTTGTIARQSEAGELGLSASDFCADDLAGLADAILARLKNDEA